MRFAAAASAFFLVATGEAKAETVWHAYTGERLLVACESAPDFCEGYILGIVDARYGEGTFCLTRDVRSGRIVDVVKGFMKEHPEYGRVDASVLVGDALKKEFPCN